MNPEDYDVSQCSHIDLSMISCTAQEAELFGFRWLSEMKRTLGVDIYDTPTDQ